MKSRDTPGDGRDGQREHPRPGPPVAGEDTQPAVRERGSGQADEGRRAEYGGDGAAAAQPAEGDEGSGRDTREGEGQDAGAEAGAAGVGGRRGDHVGDGHGLRPGRRLGGEGLRQQLGDGGARGGRGQQARTLRGGDDRAVDLAVLQGGAGGGLVGVPVDLEGPLVGGEPLLQRRGRGGGSGDAEGQVAGGHPGGGPGEGPEGQRGEERDQHHHGQDAARGRDRGVGGGCHGHGGHSIQREGSFVLRPGPTVCRLTSWAHCVPTAPPCQE